MSEAGPRNEPAPTQPEYLRQVFRPKWVVARRTRSILERYGPDVVTLTQKQLRAAERDYRERWGEPYDPIQRNLHMALRDVLRHFAFREDGDLTRAGFEALVERARAAIGDAVEGRARS